MSDATGPEGTASVPVRVTVDVPRQIAEDLDALVAEGVFLSVDEAMRQALQMMWRFEKGTFHTLRPDLRRDGEQQENAQDEQPGTDEG